MNTILITKFDEIDYTILDTAMHSCYIYNNPKINKRALEMMDEGILDKCPIEKWVEKGWQFTDYGVEYAKAFMQKVKEKHGHQWMTYRDTSPEFYDEDDYCVNDIDTFAFSAGYHNGPKCKKCGYSFCHHCQKEFNIPKCEG